MGREFFSKVVGIWWPTFAFVILSFDHVVANMFYLPLGIFLGTPGLSVGYYIAHSMIPSLLGNIIGGGLFVGVVYWYLVRHLAMNCLNWIILTLGCSTLLKTASPTRLTTNCSLLISGRLSASLQEAPLLMKYSALDLVQELLDRLIGKRAKTLKTWFEMNKSGIRIEKACTSTSYVITYCITIHLQTLVGPERPSPSACGSSTLDRRACSRANVLASCDQESTSLDLAVGVACTLEHRRISALERAVRPGAGLPRVSRSRDRRHKRNLRAANIVDGNVVLERRSRAAEVEANIAVLPRSVALHIKLAGVAVVDESLLCVLERDAVLQDVVGGRVAGDAELEAVAVAFEAFEVPAVDAVAPGVNFLHRYGGAELEKVETVVDVVPQAGVAEDVALAGAFLAGESIGALAVFAGVTVAV